MNTILNKIRQKTCFHEYHKGVVIKPVFYEKCVKCRDTKIDSEKTNYYTGKCYQCKFYDLEAGFCEKLHEYRTREFGCIYWKGYEE